ncbi:hypothetical protein [Edaphobacter flagellatus]|uniref:hypothetical protein n=1 Tax=Edaphobacter flagellatus TaxID=1933044 RepID=UPI0021B23C25|nr:hypothetical protein [Edaphobacter flagellatus]
MNRQSENRAFMANAAIALVLFFVSAIYASAQAIPPGTSIVVKNDSALSSAAAQKGSSWTGTLVEPISVNGKVVAARGAKVRGRVADATSSGRLSKPGALALEVTSVRGIRVNTDVYAADGEGHTKSNATKIGGGAAAGALLGGIFGGGKGAAVGALAGGGAGTAVAAGTGKKEATIAAETTMSFQVQ